MHPAVTHRDGNRLPEYEIAIGKFLTSDITLYRMYVHRIADRLCHVH